MFRIWGFYCKNLSLLRFRGFLILGNVRLIFNIWYICPVTFSNFYRLELFDKIEFDKWVQKGEAPAILPSLELYRDVLSLGFKIFLLTGRNELHRLITTKNLIKAGFHHWDKLILRWVWILNLNPFDFILVHFTFTLPQIRWFHLFNTIYLPVYTTGMFLFRLWKNHLCSFVLAFCLASFQLIYFPLEIWMAYFGSSTRRAFLF